MKTRLNPFVAAAVALPLLVVVLFVVASALPRLWVEPPQHALVVVQNRWNDTATDVDVEIAVVNGRANVVVSAKPKPDFRGVPRVFYFDPTTEAVREISIELPVDAQTLSAQTTLSVPELDVLAFSTKLVAPDGYEYRGDTRSSGFFITELFGGRTGGLDPTIAKSGHVIRVRLPHDSKWRQHAQLLGWVVDE